MIIPPRHPAYQFPAQAGTKISEEFGSIIAKEFNLPAPLGEILFHRGFQTLPDVESFLYPHLSMLPSPLSMKGMREAVQLVHATYVAGLPICIHGDYDVDGITATALLVAFFREIGVARVVYAIPDRMQEGYGLSPSSIDRLLERSGEADPPGLLITVDCGIAAFNGIAYARQRGFRVLVTDHHEPQTTLPEADVIVDPKQQECNFSFTHLSGVGVAFFLIMALRSFFAEAGLLRNRLPNLKKYLDLVALGTVADVVPLVGINRILVRGGLEILSAKRRAGILALCDQCDMARRDVLTDDIAFKLAPRINACGRLGQPEIGVELLLADNPQKANLLAQELNRMNIARKQLESRALRAVSEQCEQLVRDGCRGLVVYQPDCHPGVLGIVASRITDRFHCPAIVLTDAVAGTESGELKGSGRSIAGLHLFQLLQSGASFLKQFGGHAMAAGLTLDRSRLEEFAAFFNQQVSLLLDARRRPAIAIDYYLHDKSILTKGFSRGLQLLQPFGQGNDEPVFLLSCERLLRPRRIKNHLRFQLQTNAHIFPGIGFYLATGRQNFQEPLDLVFHLKRNWFRGVEHDQIQVLHLFPCDDGCSG
ncbi:MAG: single-stranded-DNA-specific exonuclease RecJ [Desulfobulbus sp.]|jgi:single-stranded-DNA-specific exonuclease